MSTGNSETRDNFADRVVDDYSGYKVYDRDGDNLGKVEYTVLDEQDQPEYLAIKTGFFGGKTTLIPEEIIRLDDSGDFTAQTDEKSVNDAPTLDSRDEVSRDIIDRTRDHYGLGTSGSSRREEPRQDEYREEDRRDRDHRDEDHRNEDRRDREYRDEDRVEHESRSTSDVGRESSERSDDRRDRESSRSTSSRSDDRTEVRDTDDIEHRDRGSSRDDDREQIRVTLKREEARAERVVDEDGEVEVRIRKKTVKEETLVDVEDEKNL